ncbi:MAG: hypothetical protein GXP34_07335 [Actinobacteria bacterium]|nr:hypothetical protein [Actinomycetota bacterium]
MRSLTWTAAIWAVVLIFIARGSLREILHKPESGWSMERLAIVLVLLGSFTNAAKATANEVLADPVILERVVRGALVLLGGLVVAPSLLRNLRSAGTRIGPGLTALWAYILVAALSVLYSVAPIVTAPKVVELLVGLAIITSIATSSAPKEHLRQAIQFIVILEAALITTAVIGFFVRPGTFAMIGYRPGFLLPTTMGSPWASSNSLSASAGLVAAYALASYFRGGTLRVRAGWMTLFAIGTIGTVLASGRQGVAIWMVAIGILLWLHRRRLFLLLLGPATLGMVFLNWQQLLSILSRNQSAQSLALLTGRVRFWTAALSSLAAHPWTGFGFGAGGRFVALRSIGEGSRSNLHSGYLEALLGVGLIGTILLLFAVVWAAWWSVRQLRRRIRTHYAILIVPLILHTFVDLGFGAWLKADFLLLASLVALADLDRRASRIARAQPPDLDSSRWLTDSRRGRR